VKAAQWEPGVFHVFMVHKRHTVLPCDDA